MKKYILACVFLISGISWANAQKNPPGDEEIKHQRIQALYVAFVTKQLELTTEEAQKFWPVHTAFAKEISTVKANQPELEKQQSILNIKKKYQGSFAEIIGTNRTERFFKINGEFTKKLLERIKNARQNQRPGMQRRGNR